MIDCQRSSSKRGGLTTPTLARIVIIAAPI